MSSTYNLYLTRLLSKIFPFKKTWARAQDYELYHAILGMRNIGIDKMREWQVNKMSSGYINPATYREFFDSDASNWSDFIEHIRDRKCLEIGPSIIGEIITWDLAADRHIIEPLFDEINRWQIDNLGFSLFEGIRPHSVGAEVLVTDLVGEIDGAIFCRNCIDHSPDWVFILANISHYARPGCKLLLWNDLDHSGTADQGHYDITKDTQAFKRLVQAFGFEIIREYQDVNRTELNWGCFAQKL